MMAVAVLLLLHLGRVFVLQKTDPSFLLFDSAGYYALALRLHDFMINIVEGVPLSFFAEWRDIAAMTKWHGCFVEAATAVFYFIFGRGEDSTVLIADALFGGTLLFSVYAVGKKWHSRACGMLAAVFLSFTPGFLNHSRVYMLDIPLAAMVTLTFYLVWPLDSWIRKRRAYLTGVAAGLGLLVKLNFILFAAPMFGFIFLQSWRRRDVPGGCIRRNIVAAVALAAVVSGVFYGPKFNAVASRIYETSYGRAFYERVFFSWGVFASEFASHAALFFRSFVPSVLSPVFLIVLLLAFPPFLRSSLKKEEKIFLCLCVAIPLSILVVFFRILPYHMAHKIRYALPVLPFLSLIAAAGVLSCRRSYFFAAIGSVFCWGAVQFFLPSCIFGEAASFVSPSVFGRSILPSYQEVRGILEQILTLENEDEAFEILFLHPLPRVYFPLESEAMRNHRMVRIKRPPLDAEAACRRGDIFPDPAAWLAADYVVLLEHPLDSRVEFLEEWQRRQAAEAAEAFENRRADFALIRDLPFGSGNRLLIYKNQTKVRTVAAIMRGALKFTFDRGRGRIFWKEHEVTSGAGLFASFIYEGVKHDSFDAVWDVEKIDGRQISLTGRWPGFPLRQHWQITLGDAGAMHWRIFLEAPGGRIQHETFGLMLVDAYAGWFVPGRARGPFHETRRRFLKYWQGAVASAGGGIGCRGRGGFPDAIFQIVSSRHPVSYLIFDYNEMRPARGLACFHFRPEVLKQTVASPRYEIKISFAE